MAVAFKSAGAKVEGTGATIAVPVPALAVGDYAVMTVATLSSTPPTIGNGWVFPVSPNGSLDGSLYYWHAWKYATGAELAGTESVGNLNALGLASVLVFTGAENSAPTRVFVASTPAVPYWPTGTLTVLGMWAHFVLGFAPRTPSGVFTNTGSLTTSAATNRLHSSTTNVVNGRWSVQTYMVTAQPGTVRVNFTVASNSTSASVALLIPELVIPQRTGSLPVVAGLAATSAPIASTSGQAGVVVGLTAHAAPVGSAAGALGVVAGLLGHAAPLAIASGSLGPIEVGLSAQAIPVGVAQGVLDIQVGLEAQASPVVSVTGALGADAGLAGDTTALLRAGGSLGVELGLSGATGATVASVSGQLVLVAGLLGHASAVLPPVDIDVTLRPLRGNPFVVEVEQSQGRVLISGNPFKVGPPRS